MDYQKFVNNASFTIFVAVVGFSYHCLYHFFEKWLERSRKVGSKQGRAKKNCY